MNDIMITRGGPFDVAWQAWGVLVVLLLVMVLAVVALLALRRRPLDEIPRFLWALLIVVAPVLGPIVFFIVRPGNLPPEQRKSI